MKSMNPTENMTSDKISFENYENNSGFYSDTRNDMIDAIRQILSEQEADSYES